MKWDYLLLWLSCNFIILSWVNNSLSWHVPRSRTRRQDLLPCLIMGQQNNLGCLPVKRILGSSCCPPNPMSLTNDLLLVMYQWLCAGVFFYSWLSPSSCCLSVRSFSQANQSRGVSGINSQKELREELSARSWLNASELSPLILPVGWERQQALLKWG